MYKRASFIAILLFVRVYSLPSCEKPLRLTKKTTIYLTEDLIVTCKGTPFIAEQAFGTHPESKLIIISKTGNAIRVTKNSIWDLSSFKSKTIEFAGNAKLICEPGSRLLFDNTRIRFTQNSRGACL